MIEPSRTLAATPMQGGVEAVYAGVDWLSASYPAERPGRWAWSDECRIVIEEIAAEGHKLEARSWNGYRGLGAGGSFFGSRDDGSYLQLSGHYADRLYDRVYRDDLHISRLDVQATIRYMFEEKSTGPMVYKKSVDANAALSSHRQRRIWYMSGSDGGYTAYIGSPSSEQRARVYNKAIQSEQPEYARCWRWEVVFRNNYAQLWGDYIFQEADNRPDYCARIVVSWFLARGVPVLWWFHGDSVAMPLIKEIPSDAEKKLKWLEGQVRPALRWLYDNGFYDEALTALGIGSVPLPPSYSVSDAMEG